MLSMLRTITIAIAAANLAGWATWRLVSWISPSLDVGGAGEAFFTAIAAFVSFIAAIVIDRMLQERCHTRADVRETFAAARVVSARRRSRRVFA